MFAGLRILFAGPFGWLAKDWSGIYTPPELILIIVIGTEIFAGKRF
jgi:hypothetical protein